MQRFLHPPTNVNRAVDGCRNRWIGLTVLFGGPIKKQPFNRQTPKLAQYIILTNLPRKFHLNRLDTDIRSPVEPMLSTEAAFLMIFTRFFHQIHTKIERDVRRTRIMTPATQIC
jgi:hypothetical protein